MTSEDSVRAGARPRRSAARGRSRKKQMDVITAIRPGPAAETIHGWKKSVSIPNEIPVAYSRITAPPTSAAKAPPINTNGRRRVSEAESRHPQRHEAERGVVLHLIQSGKDLNHGANMRVPAHDHDDAQQRDRDGNLKDRTVPGFRASRGWRSAGTAASAHMSLVSTRSLSRRCDTCRRERQSWGQGGSKAWSAAGETRPTFVRGCAHGGARTGPPRI